MKEDGSWETRIMPDLASFIEEQTSIFLGTANGERQPYIQHCGSKGFLEVVDDKTIALSISRTTGNTSGREPFLRIRRSIFS